MPMSSFDFLVELKNICVKILLLKSIRDIPIFTQTIENLCIRKLVRKRKDPPIIKLGGHFDEILCGKLTIEKYSDLGNTLVTANIKIFPLKTR